MKKKLKFVFVFALCLALYATSDVLAANENYSFSFSIKSWNGNTRSGGRYRQTTNAYNAWKVNLVKSTEGAGNPITRFWLETYNGTNVSPAHNVNAGSKNHFYAANSSASKATVYLTAENNNFTGQTYSVSGYWDEETGINLK